MISRLSVIITQRGHPSRMARIISDMILRIAAALVPSGKWDAT
jgi:hypothetical protein